MNNYKNIELIELVEAYAADNGLIDSEETLSEAFDSMLEECFPDFDKDDEVAINEDFNNWSDSLCKDGLIHEEQYRQYCYIGKYSS